MCDPELVRSVELGASPMEFSDYIVYADESGDHRLDRIDPKHPVFVLNFCVFRK